MEKSNTKEFLKVAIITFITSILLLFAFLTLQINGVFVQIGIPPNGISHQALSNLLIIMAIVSLIYLFDDRGIKGIIIAIGVFFIIVASLPNLLIEAEYTRFSSPDNKEEFIVIERGHGRLYQLSNSRLFMTYLTSINTDDGYKPFSDSAYKLEWEEPNQLIIHYKFDSTLDSLSEKVSTRYKVK
ncbi:hypothetical protein [Bacillus sp. UMB0728]|uniref:hypothetical protein n=1 Tax=Bacillus sp. UMB0728 TaxID=2066052 RepID=UPI000C76047C|nr:hypothetical protein [Bacillus sp. UMB0728]PLR70674.1 hypothetical protein CYJ37_21870 [Bacillus sp. UMB0728]